jgi:hypothetical protein
MKLISVTAFDTMGPHIGKCAWCEMDLTGKMGVIVHYAGSLAPSDPHGGNEAAVVVCETCFVAKVVPPSQWPRPRLFPETDIYDAEFGKRARHGLQLLGLRTLGEIAERTEAELLAVKGFKGTSLREVKETLERAGLKLKETGAT